MRIAMESPGQGVGAAGLVELLRHGVGFGLIVEQAGIQVADGAHFEFGGDQAFDQGVFDFVEGLETVAELVEELEEFLGSASGGRNLPEVMPWTRLLRLEMALPWGVRGPVLFFAFSRLALVCAAVAMIMGPLCNIAIHAVACCDTP